MSTDWLSLTGGARFAWSGDRLMIDHVAPNGTRCICVVQNAKGHFRDGSPVSLTLPVHCVHCGITGRLTDGRWDIVPAETTT